MKWFKLPQDVIAAKRPIQFVKLEGTSFCLIYHQDEWHATSYKCPHAGANLADSWCENGHIICPHHRHHFDLKTGKGAAGQNNFIRIYQLQERQDGWYIELPQSFFSRIFK